MSLIFIFTYVYVYMSCVSRYPWRQESVRYPRAGDTAGCEPPDIGAGN